MCEVHENSRNKTARSRMRPVRKMDAHIMRHRYVYAYYSKPTMPKPNVILSDMDRRQFMANTLQQTICSYTYVTYLQA